EIPKKLIIVGGGYIGTELGTVYGKLGSEVHILEGSPNLIPQLDREIVAVVAKELEKFNVSIHYNALAKQVEVKDNQVQVGFEEEGSSQTLIADKVMVVVGRKPNSSELGLEDIGVNVNEKGFIE